MFVKSGYEDKIYDYFGRIAASVLEDIDYTIYIPQRNIYERKVGVRKKVTRKLFPGYVLIETDRIIEFYYRTKNLPHIINLLRNNEDFLEIHTSDIEQITSMADDKGLIDISNVLIIDDRIQVVQGPLLGKEGIIKKIDKRKGRAKVLFSLNKSDVLIDLGINLIQKQ